jgi:ureidoacrylate peracid hydrolase
LSWAVHLCTHRPANHAGADTLIITGTATTVCCESTAPDAMQMNYKSSSWADGNAALIDAEHKVTLNNMATLFADVMTTQGLGFSRQGGRGASCS